MTLTFLRGLSKQVPTTRFIRTMSSLPQVKIPGCGSTGRVGLGLMFLTAGARPVSEEEGIRVIKWV